MTATGAVPGWYRPAMTRAFASILITGASSGIGAALAQHYAAPGIRLALQGRDRVRLDAVAAACRGRGAAVATAVLDVTDHAALAAWIAAMDDAGPLDLVVANAGISGGSSGAAEGEAQARRIFAVNVDGTLATLYPALARMRRRGTGTIALMSSLAGFRGVPGAPAYTASKAGDPGAGRGAAAGPGGGGDCAQRHLPGLRHHADDGAQ